jgi:hypothetical protein
MILNNVLTHIFTQWSKERDRQSGRIHLQVLGQYFNPSSPSHVLSTSDLPRHMVPCDVLRTFVATLTFGVNVI